jgi:hypothetical protein
MMLASGFDGAVSDRFTLEEDGLTTTEVNIGWCQIGDAFMVAQMFVVADVVSDFLFEITGQVIVFEQDAVLEGLVPTLDLAMDLRMHLGTTQMIHTLAG